MAADDGPGMWECRNGDPEIGGGIDKTCLKTPYFHCTVSKLLKEFQMIFHFYSFFHPLITTSYPHGSISTIDSQQLVKSVCGFDDSSI